MQRGGGRRRVGRPRRLSVARVRKKLYAAHRGRRRGKRGRAPCCSGSATCLPQERRLRPAAIERPVAYELTERRKKAAHPTRCGRANKQVALTQLLPSRRRQRSPRRRLLFATYASCASDTRTPLAIRPKKKNAFTGTQRCMRRPATSAGGATKGETSAVAWFGQRRPCGLCMPRPARERDGPQTYRATGGDVCVKLKRKGRRVRNDANDTLSREARVGKSSRHSSAGPDHVQHELPAGETARLNAPLYLGETRSQSRCEKIERANDVPGSWLRIADSTRRASLYIYRRVDVTNVGLRDHGI